MFVQPLSCFHCGLPVPEAARFSFRYRGLERSLCCAGCEAAAVEIVRLGLERYYEEREPASGARAALPPELVDRLADWDRPTLLNRVATDDTANGASLRRATLLLENLRCAACVWLAERTLTSVDGLHEASINFATRRAEVRWDPGRTTFSALLRSLARIGLVAHPFEPSLARSLAERERRDRLLRFLVAGAFGMQVMTLAVALYTGSSSGMEPEIRQFFRWMSLLLTAPVLFYSGMPFLQGMFEDLRHGRVGMDVPVATGLLLGYLGSFRATLVGDGEIYFDSVCMFVFLLHGARLLESGARRRATSELDLLVRPSPATAWRLTDDGSEERVASTELVAGDRIRVRPGEMLPADGRILDREALLDESLLNGESLPVRRGVGETAIGGSTNAGSSCEIEVTAVGDSTVLASIERLVERARADKPSLARLADRIASRFSLAVLIFAAAAALYWWRHDPVRTLPILISLLVASCPCALALATPLAFAATNGALARRGFLVVRESAIEALASTRAVVFDKTGTLTAGRPRLVEVRPAPGQDAHTVLGVAAALEQGSEHPLARSIRAEVPQPTLSASGIVNLPGRGVRGTVDGEEAAAGSPEFVEALLGDRAAPVDPDRRTIVAVARRGTLLGTLHFQDALRPGAAELIGHLERAGVRSELLSGDQATAVNAVARELGIASAEGGAAPERKVARIRQLTADGEVVAMVGDGVNDAAGLAAASVSVAIGEGAFLAAQSADAVLASGSLESLTFAFTRTRRTMRVVRGNFARALFYNALVLPAAAAGLVPPWAAALGMTGSSLLVTYRALRLGRPPGPMETAPTRIGARDQPVATSALPGTA
ncbi:MAG: heavy metal translocating P-type ATPase [Thermoanaerobaculia bacterium]